MRNFVFKILVGGDGAVGKTTLLRKYVDGTFDESSIATVGVDFFIKQVVYENVGSCTLQIWDLGGQERFRHLLESFIMGAKGALLLFDLTSMPKIDKILNWVNIVRMHDFDLPILLVGTKLDLEEFIAVDDESAQSIKNAFNMIEYIKTSSKTGVNVERVFDVIVEKLMEKKMFASKADLLKEALREYLERHKDEIDVTTFDIVESRLILEKERILEKTREDELLEWAEKLRT